MTIEEGQKHERHVPRPTALQRRRFVAPAIHGRRHVLRQRVESPEDPAERSKSIGASTGFTVFLGVAEVLGSLGVALGILTQLAAIGLILLMLGAIQKKIFDGRSAFGEAERTAGTTT